MFPSTTQLLTGFGSPDFTRISGSLGKFFHVEPLAFGIDGSSKKEESFKFVNGKRVRAGSKIIEELFSMKVEIEAASWTAIQFALGKEAANVPSINLPEVRYATVSAAGEIADPDLGAALGVQTFVTESGVWGKEGGLTLLATGSPTATQFKVDGTNNKIILNTALAGAVIAYRLIKVYTNLNAIGVQAVEQALNLFSFSGVCYTDTDQFYKIIIPKMSRASVASLKLGEKTKFEVEFDLSVAAGKPAAYQLIELPDTYIP
jgi:hypothetical protein